jgi:hypothetical protein
MVLQPRDVFLRRVVDRGDLLVFQRDADQHSDQGLRHRHRDEAALGGAPVLVALCVDRVALHNEEAGVAIGREELVDIHRRWG